MTKLHTRASVAGASLSGANLKSTNTSTWDALNTLGVTDSNRTTVTASGTLTSVQCGIVLVDCTSGSIALVLPTSGTGTDEAFYQIRRIDSVSTNTLTVVRGSTDTVEGLTTTFSIGCGGQMDFKMPAGSTNWRVTGRSGGTTLAAREALGVQAVNWLDNPDGEIYQDTIAATADDTYMDDQWYALTQTSTITPSQQSNPEDGFAFAARITQSQVTAQRMGEAQILEGKRTRKLRGKTMTFGGRFKTSGALTLRVAILAWTSTEDSPTSDVVNDWTSGTYTAGNFFLASNLTVVAVGSAITAPATTRDVSVTGTIPSNATNVIVFYWTESTAAQNVTIDAWGRRLVEGVTLLDYIRRTEQEELERCQRFLQFVTFISSFIATAGSQDVYNIVNYPVTMRTTPTVTKSGLTITNATDPNPATVTAANLQAFMRSSAAGSAFGSYIAKLSARL